MTRRFTILMGGFALAIVAFVWWTEYRLDDITSVYRQIGGEWTEISRLNDIRSALFGLHQAIAKTDGDLGQQQQAVAEHLALCHHRIQRLVDFQHRQKDAQEKAQSKELRTMSELSALLDQAAARWQAMTKNAVTRDPTEVAGLLQMVDRGNSALDAFLHVSDSEIHDEVKQIHRTEAQIDRAFILLGACLLTLFAMLAVGFFVSIIRPLRHLRDAAMRFRRRREIVPVASLARRDEIGELAGAFHGMACELQSFTQDLERQIDERTRELIRSEKLAAAGRLAAGLAHEINNPLASIGACAEGLQRRLSDPSEPLDEALARDYLETVVGEVRRCKTIIERLLDFTRIKQVQRRRNDLAGLCRQTMRLVEHAARERGCELAGDFPDEPVYALCDGDQIKQILLNLLLNAMDACPGGGHIRVGLRAGEDGPVELSVSDDGVGITPETMDHLFEPFFSKKSGAPGLGLGLPVCQWLAEAHGGCFHVQSEGAGRGTRFTLELPLWQARDEAEVAAERSS